MIEMGAMCYRSKEKDDALTPWGTRERLHEEGRI